MRIDKFLKTSRIIKRRTVAQEACDGHRIKVNGNVVKSSKDVKVGDIISISFGNRNLTIKVKELNETSTKATASDMYEIIEG